MTESTSKFVAGQKTPCCYLTPGYFRNTKIMYTSEEHHLYSKDDYTESNDTCYWVCQNKGCKARIKTKGNPKNLSLFDPMDCWFTDLYEGHVHPTKEQKSKKQAKYEVLKVQIDTTEPSASSKTSVAREIFDKMVSSQE